MSSCDLETSNCRCAPTDTVPWSAFLPNVMPYAQKVPASLAEHFVRISVIEMSRKVLNLQRDLYIDTQECVADYRIDLPDGYHLHMIREVCHNKQTLRAVEATQCHAMCGSTYYFEEPCTILLGTAPRCDEHEGLYVRAIVQPGQESCEIDRWVFEQYAEDIAMGALSRIMLMKDSDWYDPRQGGIMLRRWKGVLATMRVERGKNNNAGPTMIKVPRFV